MPMSGAQVTAFQAASGFTPSAASLLWLSLTFALVLLWGAWTLLSLYRGWAKRSLDGQAAAAYAVRWIVLCMTLSFLLLH